MEWKAYALCAPPHPSTGQWVHMHPDKGRLEGLYQRYWRGGDEEEGAA